MKLNYLQNIYQARSNQAEVRKSGLEEYLYAHNDELKKRRSQLLDLRNSLLQAMHKTAGLDDKDLSADQEYQRIKEAYALKEAELQAFLQAEMLNYCQKHNYRIYYCAYCQDTGVLANKQACKYCLPAQLAAYLQELGLYRLPLSFKAQQPDQTDISIYARANSPADFQAEIANYRTNYKYAAKFAQAILAETANSSISPSPLALSSSSFKHNLKHNIILYGVAGSGKSYYAAKIASYLMQEAILALYLDAEKLGDLYVKRDLLAASFNPDSRQKDYNNTCFAVMQQADLIVIDDLSINTVSPKHLLSFLNNVPQRQHLIVTTNYSPNELQEAYGERIFSRLFQDTEPVSFKTNDLRLFH